MSTIDMVFEGGGAKGIVFTGALEVLLGGEHPRHTHGRLLGTSAGAITAVSLAAGYTPAEMLAALAEKDPLTDRSRLAGFLGLPAPFDEKAIRGGAIRKLLADLNLPLVPDFTEARLDDWIAEQLATNEQTRHLFAFVERGGWFSADPFLTWVEERLDHGAFNGQPRRFSAMTLEQFHAATGADVTLIAADTDSRRMLWLNHRTAPNCPVKYAARMSMSVPLLWEEVKWQRSWGPYLAWNPKTRRLEEQDLTGHAIVDGGLVSNFPIALFLAARDDVTAVVGPPHAKNVLGFLIDETLPVTVPAAPAEVLAEKIEVGSLETVQRLSRLVNTATSAHDNMAIAAFAPHVVRLPAGGYGTTQFDMTDGQRNALVAAGRQAMQDFLRQQVVLEGTDQDAVFAASDAARALANEAAATILGR